MRKWIILLGLIPILAVFNYAIYDKQKLIEQGEAILLQLAPADPRSIMQGDYMRLRYQASIDATKWLKNAKKSAGEAWTAPSSDLLVLVLDEQKKARFNRFFTAADTLGPNERLLSFAYAKRWGTADVKIHPDSFFFQEGKATAFQIARFGMMRLHSNGDHLLVGLADEAGIEINPRP